MKDVLDVKRNINYTSLARQVYHHIKRMIMTQELKGGQRIPEEAIANVFGVSRTPIREAMRELEKHGLVKIYPRKYAEVVQLEQEDKIHIGQLRIQLDTLSVKLLCGSITEEQHQTLREYAAKGVEYAENGDFASCYEMDSSIHCGFAEFSGNKYLHEMVRTLDLKVQLLRNIQDWPAEKIIRSVRTHFEIIDAIYRNRCDEVTKMVFDHLAEYYFGSPKGE